MKSTHLAYYELNYVGENHRKAYEIVSRDKASTTGTSGVTKELEPSLYAPERILREL